MRKLFLPATYIVIALSAMGLSLMARSRFASHHKDPASAKDIDVPSPPLGAAGH